MDWFVTKICGNDLSKHWDKKKDDDILCETLAIGGDPTLSISFCDREHYEPIEALDFTLAYVDHDTYGFGKLDEDSVEN